MSTKTQKCSVRNVPFNESFQMIPILSKLDELCKSSCETVKLNFWDLISMTSPLPWKQLALILLLGGGVICPSHRFLLHRIRKLCQDLSFCNIWKYTRTKNI